MASTAQERELVLCHGCENEWYRDEHGLQCPQCQCDIVEIVCANTLHACSWLIEPQIDPQDDPRSENPPLPERPNVHHSLHDHNPWRDDASDPDEENIDHVSFSPAPGVHFQRTLVRSGGSRTGQRGRSPNDETVDSLFQALGGFLQGNMQNREAGPHRAHGVMFSNGPQFATQNPFPTPPHAHHHHPQVRMGWSTGQNGLHNGRGPTQNARNDPFIGIQGMVAQMVAQLHGVGGQQTPNNHGPGLPSGMPDFLAQLFNPANAVHGDAVYSQEAFDRIIGQMMEQNGGSTAPGPASEVAIAALPKKKVDKTMMGSDGKAECSVCMDNVEIGDEVTTLPCHHWFHEQCVSIWLKEHDTCPHCRKGITPAEGEPDTPRSPHQPPRHNTNPFDRAPPPMPSGAAAPFTQPGMQHPYVPGGYPTYPEPQAFVQPPQPPPPPPRPSDHPHSSYHRTPSRSVSGRSSASSRGHSGGERANPNGNGNGGVTGWFRNLRSRNHDD